MHDVYRGLWIQNQAMNWAQTTPAHAPAIYGFIGGPNLFQLRFYKSAKSELTWPAQVELGTYLFDAGQTQGRPDHWVQPTGLKVLIEDLF